ncbi:hypothetical protein GCM10027259_06280 [Micromonospora palomenae]
MGVGWIELVVLDPGGIGLLEPLGELASDQVVVDARLKIRHLRNLAGQGAEALSRRGAKILLSGPRQISPTSSR